MKTWHRYFFVGLTIFFASCKQEPKDVASIPTNQEVFTQIYERGEWGKNALGEGCSGEGSSVCNAKPYMEFLQDFLQEYEIKSVVDVGCGDWEFSKYLDWSGIRYTGIDVVKSVIEKNSQNFGEPTVTFICADAAQLNLPKTDLLICKDVLQHLPLKDIFALCSQFSNFKYCLITNDIINPFCLLQTNEELSQPGGCRTLDLTLPPFNFKAKKVFTYSVPTCDRESIKEVVLIEIQPSMSP